MKALMDYARDDEDVHTQKFGVRFGSAPMEEAIARDRVNTARQLMAQGKTAAHAAKTVGWSKATLYRYMKTYDGALAPREAIRPKRAAARSRYVEKDTLPARE
ncbi:helix-turn-helix domain-containing protein [Arthrobacter oryzae]|uniref:helix-turn-helix domain-containing protein n=1 Tax=Arthrobacter oryzae TaxID=409290 RepID=UPI00273C1DF2|nr:helix-turn-helix domain-containing protein [Arthrobacter oryzae]WLQ04786.1 helix-turn-helix domain-containing protein [Arthrobacter oryzae]